VTHPLTDDTPMSGPAETDISAGWGDKWARVRASTGVILVGIVGVFTALSVWYLFNEHRLEAERANVRHVERYDTIIANQEAIKRMIQNDVEETRIMRLELVYIMSLSEDQKKRLNLDMAASLRSRVTDR